MSTRAKLSTTVAPETIRFLQHKVESGEAGSVSEALDAVVARIRRLENRRRLSEATARYFDELDETAVGEETALGASLSSMASQIDVDKEP